MSSLKKSHHYVQSTQDPTIKLHVRKAKGQGQEHESNKRAILFVHGAVLPSILFDVETPHPSWLDDFATHGYDSYALDLRGYGESTKPSLMNESPLSVPPQCSHDEAIQDIKDVIQWIKNDATIEKIHLCGLSWGSVLAGKYVTLYPHDVDRMILLGPVYSYSNPLWRAAFNPEDHYRTMNPALGGYTMITRDQASLMWTTEIPYPDKTLLRDRETLKTILDTLMESDKPWCDALSQKDIIRIPTGVTQDILSVYNQKPLYDAPSITHPVLILRGEYDSASHPDDVMNLFQLLGSKEKLLINMGNATHYALCEKQSPTLQKICRDFLENHSKTPLQS